MAKELGCISDKGAEVTKELTLLEDDQYILGSYAQGGECLGEITMSVTEVVRLWQLLDGMLEPSKVIARLLDDRQNGQEAVLLQDKNGERAVCIRVGDSMVSLSVEDAKQFAQRLQDTVQ